MTLTESSDHSTQILLFLLVSRGNIKRKYEHLDGLQSFQWCFDLEHLFRNNGCNKTTLSLFLPCVHYTESTGYLDFFVSNRLCSIAQKSFRNQSDSLGMFLLFYGNPYNCLHEKIAHNLKYLVVKVIFFSNQIHKK